MINKSCLQNRIGKFVSGIAGVLFLFYIVSCSSKSTSSTSTSTSPSSDVVVDLDPIKNLTLKEVGGDSIILDWELLKTKEGIPDHTIFYTVYAGTPDEKGVFRNIPSTETIYTLLFPVDLGGGRKSTLLLQDDTGRRTSGVTVRGLTNNTPYLIVVEASDSFGNTRQSELFAYTASALTDSDISGLEATTAIDSEEITVTWDPKEGAQSYLIQATSEGENQFGGSISIDRVLVVVCPPGSLLCVSEDQFAQEEGGKLKYVLQVNKKGKYKLVVIPFNFQDLGGLQSVDEDGQVKIFIEEVLIQIEDENSVLSQRLKDGLNDPDQIKEIQIKVSKAEAPTDLVLESTGNTLSANWGHGEGAEYYYAILTSGGVDAVTNTIDRYDSNGKFAGGGHTSFNNLNPATLYTVTVQSLTVIDNTTNVGGEVSATLSTKDAENTLNPPQRVTGEDLILINDEAGKLRITWSTPEANSVIAYNVFYWMGDVSPDIPEYVAKKGDTNLSFTVPPGSYRVRVNVLSTYPGQEIVNGDTNSLTVYSQPLAPQGLGVAFAQGVFTNIVDKLYAIGYPLTYTEAKTPAEAGGPVEELRYHYRYRVEGGDWIGYSEVAGEAMVSLQVEDLSDATVVKSGYGKKYQVEMVASNGRFISEVEALEFTYQSFPEPFMQGDYLQVETGDRSLTVTWPAVSEINGSSVVNYTAILNLDPYGLPVQNKTVQASEREVVFEELVNNQSYFITVIPNSAVTGNIFTALTMATGYTIGEAIGQGSEAATILAAYTGEPTPYTPQGAPEAVVNLGVIADIDNSQATVTWRGSSTGSPATRYVLEYLTDVVTPITNVDITGDAADTELSGLSWEGATSIEVTYDGSGSYSQIVDDLNVSSAINVFRVQGIHTDTSGKEWFGRYRYYALGSEVSQAPNTVGELTFFELPADDSFTVIWTRPDDAGRDKNRVAAQLAGYRVSWGTTTEVDGGSTEITDPDVLSYTITGLSPSNQYYVKVQAKNDNQEGNIYNTGSMGSTYTMGRPGTVSSIIYSGHTNDGFKVSWDAVTDAGYGPEGALVSVGYLLDFSAQGGDWQPLARSDYSATNETLTGLISGANYRVRIIVTNEFSLAGAAGQGGETWTLSTPGPVRELGVMDPTYDVVNHNGGFKVVWEAPQDTGRTSTGDSVTITGYEVAYAEVIGDSIGAYTSVSLGATTTEYSFTGLKAKQGYDIRIRAKNVHGVGIGKSISGWAPSLPGAVDADSITLSQPTSRTIEIAWDAPEAGIIGGSSSRNSLTWYQVVIAPEGGEYSLVRDSYFSTVITVTNLAQATTYRALVTAKNAWGSTPSSLSTSTGTTLDSIPTPPAAVENIKVNSFSDSQVVFSWTAPSDLGTTDGFTAATLSGYAVKYKRESSSSFTEIDEKSQGVRLSGALTNTTTTVLGLSANTRYTFLVTAINSGNKATPDADAATVEQTMAVPAPQNLARNSATCEKQNGVDLTWTASSGATYYKLYEGTNEIRGDLTSTFYSRTGLTPSTTYTYRVKACNSDGCSGDSAPLTITTLSDKSFRSIINSSEPKIPTDLSDYDPRSREIFSRYKGGAAITVRYVRVGGSGLGYTYETASGSVQSMIDENARYMSADNVHVLLLEGGDYHITQPIIMKNHLAIVGGVNPCLGFPGITPLYDNKYITFFDGRNSSRLINNDNNGLDHTALLYGVTIAHGKADNGAGVYNNNSSPTFMWVTFIGNSASAGGGAMHNKNSSPILIGATFQYNSTTATATYGEDFGDGMHNDNSSPILIGSTFLDGMYNHGADLPGPLVINSILRDEKGYLHNDSSGTMGFRVYNSAVSTGNLESGVGKTTQFSEGWFSSGTGGGEVIISFDRNISADPRLGSLGLQGGLADSHTIPIDSPVVNQGLYVKNKGNTFYYSLNNTAWHTDPRLSSETAVTPPRDAVDLTAIDATGYARTGRPDIGTYEAR